MRYSFDLGKHSYNRIFVEFVKFGQSWSTKLVSGILFTQKLLSLKFKIVNFGRDCQIWLTLWNLVKLVWIGMVWMDLNSKSQEAKSLNLSKWALGFDILGVYFILWSIWFWFIFVHSRQITRALNLILDIKMWRGMPFTKCGTWTNAISLWRSI